MAALDLITLADLKVYRSFGGTAKDSLLALFITAASRMIERKLDRRLIYRAPPEAGAASVVNAQNWTTGAIALNVQPNSIGRTLAVTWTTATAGTLTIVGTVGGASKTVVFDAENGLVQHGTDFFTAVASATAAGAVGAGTVTVKPSLGYVEYHTMVETKDLYPLEWPVQSLLSVKWDLTRGFSASTALSTSDYILSTDAGPGDAGGARLTRIYGIMPGWWFGGYRANQIVYSGGYSLTTVPEEIKDVCRRLAILMFTEADKGQIEIASGSNALGSWSRFGPAGMTKAMQAQLWPYMRMRLGTDTGDRDFDLESA